MITCQWRDVRPSLGMPPRQLAEKVVQLLDLGDVAAKVEIAGPGFINIFLNSDWVAPPPIGC